MRIIDSLVELGKKCNTGGTAPTGRTIAAVIADIADKFNITGAAGADGKDGTDGASVTAIELELTDGVVSGGTATLSDGSEVTITVTTAAAAEQGTGD